MNPNGETPFCTEVPPQQKNHTPSDQTHQYIGVSIATFWVLQWPLD